MEIDSLTVLFFDQLRDLFSVEAQLIPAMPELIEVASNPQLKELLRQHHEETCRHRERVEAILGRHGIHGRNDRSEGMAGLIEGGSEHLTMAKGGNVRDVLLIAHCSRIEAYEIAAYRIVVSLAEFLALREECESLRGSLADEEGAMQGLGSIAIGNFTVEGFLRETGASRPRLPGDG